MADDTYTVERSTLIAVPPEQLYPEIADFHNWTKWSPWEDRDPELKRTYTGAEAGEGAAYAWSGNRKAGQGRMRITEAIDPGRVRIDLLFEKPFTSHSESVFDVRPEGSGSRVTWTMTGKKTLMTRVMGVFTSMDKLVGPDFEKGLANLKALAEKA